MRNLRTGCERRSPLETSWGQAVWSGSDDDSRPARLRLNQRLPSTSLWCETPRRTPYRSGGKPILGVTAALWRDFGSVLEPFWFHRRANRALIDISHQKLVLLR